MCHKERKGASLTMFDLFALPGSRLHPLLALEDLPEPEGDVLQVVRLGRLRFPLPLEPPIAEEGTNYS